MSEEKRPHGSHYCYKIIHDRAFKTALPGLGGPRSKGEVIFIVVLIVLASFGGSMIGFQVDQHFINPPAQLIGVCSPPAIITNGGCYIVTTSTDSSGKTHTNYQPSGTLYLYNGTNYGA